MLRLANRKDNNHSRVVQALRAAGVLVCDLTQPVDILTGYRGILRLIEIKDGEKSKSRRKLRPKQKEFFDRWAADYPVYKVETVEQALEAHGIHVD
jgi:hypothetical protein